MEFCGFRHFSNRAVTKKTVPVQNVKTLGRRKMSWRRDFNIFLWMGHFSTNTSKLETHIKIHNEVKKNKFVKKGSNGPKGAPR